jgi:hypothetical protein
MSETEDQLNKCQEAYKPLKLIESDTHLQAEVIWSACQFLNIEPQILLEAITYGINEWDT